jgi:hypothetical protein
MNVNPLPSGRPKSVCTRSGLCSDRPGASAVVVAMPQRDESSDDAIIQMTTRGLGTALHVMEAVAAVFMGGQALTIIRNRQLQAVFQRVRDADGDGVAAATAVR